MKVEPAESARGPRRLAGGREWILFGGCDYLGLAGDPAVAAAARESLAQNSLSPGGSRTTSGTHAEHLRLEEELARFLGVEAACLTGDGWIANMAALEALAPRLEGALVDLAAHPSLRRAARAAGVPIHDAPHLDVPGAAQRARRLGRVALLVDGYFPTLGERAPVAAYRQALPHGAWLLVDDAHALGVLGERGRGSAEALGGAPGRTLLTGTFSKALGTFGGFVAGASELVDAARRSEAYVCTTPIPAPLAAAARAALGKLAEDPPRPLERLRANLVLADRLLAAAGLPLAFGGLPVLALELTDPAREAAVDRALGARGLAVPRVEYPGAGPRLRIALSAAHGSAELELLVAALAEGLGARSPGSDA